MSFKDVCRCADSIRYDLSLLSGFVWSWEVVVMMLSQFGRMVIVVLAVCFCSAGISCGQSQGVAGKKQQSEGEANRRDDKSGTGGANGSGDKKQTGEANGGGKGKQAAAGPVAQQTLKQTSEQNNNNNNNNSNNSGKKSVPQAPRPIERFDRQFAAVREIAKSGKIPQTLLAIQAILDETQEVILKDQEKRPNSRRQIAEQLIESLGPAAVEEYRRQNEAAAEHLLSQAIESNSPSKLTEVLKRYFLTRAGARAVSILAGRHLDQGNILLANALLNRLSNCPTHSNQLSQQVLAKQAAITVMLGQSHEGFDKLSVKLGQRLRLGGGSYETRQWLASMEKLQSILFGGLTNDRSADLRPFAWPDWTYSNHVPRQLNGRDVDAEFNLVNSVGRPIASAHRAFMQLADRFVAIDLRSGKVLWEQKNLFAQGNNSPPLRVSVTTPVGAEYTRQMACVGDRLIRIEQGSSRRDRIEEEEEPTAGNWRIAAFECQTGKQLWSKPAAIVNSGGGVSGSFRDAALRAFGGELLLFGESRNSQLLKALSAENGNELWTIDLSLFDTNQSSDEDIWRNVADTSPALMELQQGIGACVVSRHTVVVFDAVSGIVLWSTSTEDSSAKQETPNMDWTGRIEHDSSGIAELSLSNQYLVVRKNLPNSIQVFDLVNGSLKAKTKLDETMELVGATAKNVVCASRKQVFSFPFDKPNDTWVHRLGKRMGKGILFGECAIFATADGAVLGIDIDARKEVFKVLRRSNVRGGSLTYLDGKIIETTEGQIACFSKLTEVESQLSLDKSPIGEIRRAQMLLSGGKIEASIDKLVSVSKAATDKSIQSQAQNVLFDIVEHDLLHDPKAAEPRLDQIEAIADNEHRRSLLEYLRGASLQRKGELLQACMLYFRSGNRSSGILSNDVTRDVELTPLALSRRAIEQVMEPLSLDAGRKLISQISAEWKKSSPSRRTLRGCVGTLAGLAEDKFSLEFGAELTKLGRSSEAEAVLFGPYLSPELANRSRAAIALANAAFRRGDEYVGSWYQRRAEGIAKFGLPSSENTGGVQSLTPAMPERKQVDPGSLWNISNLRVSVGKSNAKTVSIMNMFGGPMQRVFTLEETAGRVRLFDAVTLSSNQAALAEWRSRRDDSTKAKLQNCGSIVLLTHGQTMAGLSTVDRKLLWMRQDSRGAADSVTLVSPGLAILQHAKLMTAIDPWSGNELWSVGAEPASQFASAPPALVILRGKEFEVRRASDGTIIKKTRNLPIELQKGSIIIGRNLTTCSEDTFDTSVRQWDPITEAFTWTKSFPKGTTLSQIDGQQLAIREPDGKSSLMDIPSGKTCSFESMRQLTPECKLRAAFDLDEKYRAESIDRVDPEALTPPTFTAPTCETPTSPPGGLFRVLDRKSNKVLWQNSSANRIFLLSSDPSQSFLISMLAQKTPKTDSGKWTVAVELVARATGQTLWSYPLDEFCVLQDAMLQLNQQRITIRFQDRTLKLDFAKPSVK